jgi:Arc/MetJ-type ribon-helix-helix transcriptional regulator
MKIVTVNVPESYIEAIKGLVGRDSIYPSRSELIRCAVRNFLLKELKLAQNMAKYNVKETEIESFDEKNYVRIPVENKNKKGEPITGFKTYKILREA